jgi:CRP-like cAMP-binding protein
MTAPIALLKNMPIFGALSDAAIELILNQSNEVRVAGRDWFFRQDDQGQSTFVLQSGRVAVVKNWNQEEYRLRELSEGDCFGEMALIDFGPRSASVRALEDSTAIEITPRCLREVGRLDAEQYALIYMNMARELSRRLRRADERLFRAKVELQIEDFVFSSA